MTQLDWRRAEWDRKLARSASDQPLGAEPPAQDGEHARRRAEVRQRIRRAEAAYERAAAETRRVQARVRDRAEGKAALVAAQWKESLERQRLADLRRTR